MASGQWGNQERCTVRIYVEQKEVAGGKTRGFRRSLRMLTATPVNILLFNRAAWTKKCMLSILERL